MGVFYLLQIHYFKHYAAFLVLGKYFEYQQSPLQIL